jgi:hypothetical protein
MKKFTILLILLIMVVPCIMTQEVAEDEFLNTEVIEFINYEGPYDIINTLEQIKGIGQTLGRDIKPDSSLTAQYGPYKIIHSYQPEIENGLDGDILIMGSTSQVDSVTNLRHILAGYLSRAYGYEENRAFTLALFITYYNALWYQKIDHFSSRYKQGVIDNLEPDSCGLARIWSDWPGKARIVIPLRAPGSELTGIDTSIISEKEVVEVMQEEEDKRVDDRKDMVEIREKENQETEKNLDSKQEELVDKKEELDKEIGELEKNSDSLTTEEKQTLENLKEEKEVVEKEQEKVDKQKEDLAKSNEEVLDMRDDIASDENKLIDQGDQEAVKKESVFVSPKEESRVPVFFFKQSGIEEGYAYGSIELYDLTLGKKEKESTVTAIYGRSNREFSGKFLAIGKDRNEGIILPMLIDRENLAISLKGEDEIFPGTQVVIDKSNQIYMVYKKQGDWFLGRFDGELKKTANSSVSVSPMTDILFFNGKIFVQDSQGTLIVLNGETMEKERELK